MRLTLTRLNGFLLTCTLWYSPFLLYATEQYDKIDIGQQTITIAYPDRFSIAERQLTHQWLQKVTDALLTVYGELPQDHFRITIRHNPDSPGPVPWGHVNRDTPSGVVLVINPSRGYEELLHDWTAFHELSHLLLPYEGFGNVWFSEGLATYYQNIIQARSGLITETQMWDKIAAGFKRGRKEQRWQHLNLTEVSDNLGETRQFMRVHWSGVLYWLNADLTLRKQGKGTLDSALKRLKLCCQNRSMTAEQIAGKLDELTSSKTFTTLFDTYRNSHHMPDYQPVLAELGIGIKLSKDDVYLISDAALSGLREDIVKRVRR